MKLQKARTEKVCNDCGGKILKGEKYWNDYSDDLEATLSHAHTNCLLFRDSEHKPEDGWSD